MDGHVDPTDVDWVPFALTHVEFPRGDLVGKVLAIASLMPMAVIAGFITLILFRRDLHTITFFIGFLLNELLNMALKYTIRESRPMHRNVQYTEFGMPSSHSQNMWFFAVYSVFFVIFRQHRYPTKSNMLNMIHKMGIIATVVLMASCVAYSRIYLMYHTWSQILWGWVMGSIFAAIWFGITQHYLAPRFHEIVCWPVSEFLLLRDTSLIPNILWFEYTTTRQEEEKQLFGLSRTRSRPAAGPCDNLTLRPQ